MKIKIIDFGLPVATYPSCSHVNDAGADVYMKRNRNMVSQVIPAIAVYDGRENGGHGVHDPHGPRPAERNAGGPCGAVLFLKA